MFDNTMIQDDDVTGTSQMEEMFQEKLLKL